MSYALIEIDPKELVEYEGNVRTNPGDLTGMVATMREVGVVTPISVRQMDDGRYEVIAGKRRTAAAVLAGLATVPAVVVPGDVKGDRLRSLVENVQRKDLTAVEEAEGWRQLSLAGLDEATIATVAGVAPERVRKGIAVGASAVATAAGKKYELTLEQAAVLAEFESDRDAVKRLTVVAVERPAEFAHLASRIRQDKQAAAAVAAKKAELEAKGVTIYEGRRAGYGQPGPSDLWHFTNDKGKELTAAQHKKCEGHAASVEAEWSGKVVVSYVCLDPQKYKHKARYGASATPKPEAGTAEAEKAKAERAKVLAGNKEWRAAEPVRREFVTSLIARRSLPKEALPFIAGEVCGAPGSLTSSNHAKFNEVLAELSGVEAGPKVLAAAYEYARGLGLAVSKKLAPANAMLAQIAAAREFGMDVSAWRQADRSDARWLRFLESVGYGLSDIEKALCAKAEKGAK